MFRFLYLLCICVHLAFLLCPSYSIADNCASVNTNEIILVMNKFTCLFLLSNLNIHPLTGAGAYKRPERGVCSKNHKKCPE